MIEAIMWIGLVVNSTVSATTPDACQFDRVEIHRFISAAEYPAVKKQWTMTLIGDERDRHLHFYKVKVEQRVRVAISGNAVKVDEK